jgi:sphingoid base N-palmitoyltransferase
MMALWDQQDWLWNPLSYYQHFPEKSIPTLVHWYYYLEMGYYLHSTVALFTEFPPLKDRPVMLIHHTFTLALLGSSYYLNTLKYGVSIMLLHDISDPFLELAKTALYAGNKALSNASFALFASTFMILRDWIFPRYIIASIIHPRAKEIYPFYWPTAICLVGLWLLHLFWTILILRVFAESILGGSDRGDIRDEQDDQQSVQEKRKRK